MRAIRHGCVAPWRRSERWFELLDELGVRRTQAPGNFVYFDSIRQPELASALSARGIDSERAFPSLDTWSRIPIGLPEENARARRALREILAG